jgi:hypothetical protein
MADGAAEGAVRAAGAPQAASEKARIMLGKMEFFRIASGQTDVTKSSNHETIIP